MADTVVKSIAIVGQRYHPVHFATVFRHVKLGVSGGPDATLAMCAIALHRDGRKRLNRQAQCQQHDDDEFAPI